MWSGSTPRSTRVAWTVSVSSRGPQEPLVHVGGDEAVQQGGEPVAVKVARQQLGLLSLLLQHVDQLEAVQVAVLEVLQLLQEHDAGAGPVGVMRVARLAGSTSSAVARMDRIGVIPDPAATAP